MTNREVLILMTIAMRATDDDTFNDALNELLPYISTDTALALCDQYERRAIAIIALQN
jgi:hypothetical protein